MARTDQITTQLGLDDELFGQRATPSNPANPNGSVDGRVLILRRVFTERLGQLTAQEKIIVRQALRVSDDLWSSGSDAPTGGEDGDWYLRTGETAPGIYRLMSGSWTLLMSPGSGEVALTDAAVLDLAKAPRTAADRGKALATAAGNENALTLVDFPESAAGGGAPESQTIHTGTGRADDTTYQANLEADIEAGRDLLFRITKGNRSTVVGISSDDLLAKGPTASAGAAGAAGALSLRVENVNDGAAFNPDDSDTLNLWIGSTRRILYYRLDRTDGYGFTIRQITYGGGTTGVDTAAVDRRIDSLVEDFAKQGNPATIAEPKLAQAVRDKLLSDTGVLDLAKASRSAADRGKALAVSDNSEDALVLKDFPEGGGTGGGGSATPDHELVAPYDLPAVRRGSSEATTALTLPANFADWKYLDFLPYLSVTSSDYRTGVMCRIPTALLAAQTASRNFILFGDIDTSGNVLIAGRWNPSTRTFQSTSGRWYDIAYAVLTNSTVAGTGGGGGESPLIFDDPEDPTPPSAETLEKILIHGGSAFWTEPVHHAASGAVWRDMTSADLDAGFTLRGPARRTRPSADDFSDNDVIYVDGASERGWWFVRVTGGVHRWGRYSLDSFLGQFDDEDQASAYAAGHSSAVGSKAVYGGELRFLTTAPTRPVDSYRWTLLRDFDPEEIRGIARELREVIVEDPSDPVVATAAHLNKILYRGKKLYACHPVHHTGRTITWRPFASSDLPGSGRTYRGWFARNPSNRNYAVNDVVFDAAHEQFNINSDLVGQRLWQRLVVPNYIGQFGSEAEAEARATDRDQIASYGSALHIISAYTDRQPDTYEWRPLEGESAEWALEGNEDPLPDDKMPAILPVFAYHEVHPAGIAGAVPPDRITISFAERIRLGTITGFAAQYNGVPLTAVQGQGYIANQLRRVLEFTVSDAAKAQIALGNTVRTAKEAGIGVTFTFSDGRVLEDQIAFPTNNPDYTIPQFSDSPDVSVSAAEAIRSIPQSVTLWGDFDDAALIAGQPPAPRTDQVAFTDRGVNVIGGPWSGLPLGTPNWRAEAVANFLPLAGVWGLSAFVMSPVRTNSVLFATSADGAEASNIPPAGWTHFAWRLPTGALTEWLPRSQSPARAQFIWSNTDNFNAGFTRRHVFPAPLIDLDRFRYLEFRGREYGPGFSYVSWEMAARFPVEDILTTAVGLNVNGYLQGRTYRAILGGTSRVASVERVSTAHAHTSWSPGFIGDFEFEAVQTAARMLSAIKLKIPYGSGNFGVWGVP